MGVDKERTVLRESSERGKILREGEEKNLVAIGSRVKVSKGYRLTVGRGRSSGN